MWVSEIKEDNLTIDLVDRLLFQGIEDRGENADCLIVLGSMKASKYRVPVAVDVYKAGRASKLILCGGTVRDFPGGKCSEAEHMLRAVLASGIAEENVVLENASNNTVENIRFAMEEIQHVPALGDIRSVLLITTAYHMRRSLAIARQLFPSHIVISPCPANDNNTRRDNWMNTPAGRERAKSEAMNIVRYVRNGVIPDFEI